MARAYRKYISRELSWLEFNRRVLEEAQDADVPCLERLKFLAITSSNLDEFFMVRVGGLQMLAAQGVTKRDPSGLSPRQQLQAISRRTHRMVEEQYTCYLDELEPALRQAGICQVRHGELTEPQSRALAQTFEAEVFSVVTPMAVASAADFPLVLNRMLHVCVLLKGDEDSGGKPQFAIIPLGHATERFVTLVSESGYQYMLLEDVVALFIDLFFPGREVMECVPFRVTRNADMSVREDMANDLLEEMQDVLDQRKRSDCVRLEVADVATETLLSFLQRGLQVKDDDIYAVPGPVDYSAFMALAGLEGFEKLKQKPWPPQRSPQVEPGTSMFTTLARGDVLLMHPFESFEPVVRLVEEAADDPDVLAIKQILYRTSRDSPIVAALMRAARNGKYVTVIVELKARFDEARNIEWAKALEDEGVQVVYGVKGLKTHAKLCIVVRREPGGIQRYLHFGTGNYNETTARLYTDVSYMTCNPDLGADASVFFNAVTGYSEPQSYGMLSASPTTLRDKVLELIEGEIERKRQGQPARIMAKVNSLLDPDIVTALYKASQAGVKIQLNVRGICSLRPGVPKRSENIRVVSIVDRFLEHSRVFYFYRGGDEEVYLSSADWMTRNLDRRVELLVPVVDAQAKQRLIAMLETCMADTVKGRILRADGSYRRARAGGRRKALRSQEVLYRGACRAAKQAEKDARTFFQPRRPSGS